MKFEVSYVEILLVTSLLHIFIPGVASQQTNELILRYWMIKIGAETRDKISIGMIVNMGFARDDLERPNWSRSCNAV